MNDQTPDIQRRRPRFRRAEERPAFRLTHGDLVIICAVARHRFLRSNQIARIVGRSLDRTNKRLMPLFHAGYLDRPRAQLDRFPTEGSCHMVYALSEAGTRLLKAYGLGLPSVQGQKNGEVTRPFIEHQVAISEFEIAFQEGICRRRGLSWLSQERLVEAFPTDAQRGNPLKLQAAVFVDGRTVDASVIPDMLTGIGFVDGSRRCFAVEIDRGTMPITRRNLAQSSFELKMRTYLSAYAAGAHQHRYGWKSFRALTVTTDEARMQTMIRASQALPVAGGPGPALFLFTTAAKLEASDPLAPIWRDGMDQTVALI